MTTNELRTHLATVAHLAEEREDASNVVVEVERRLESLRKQQTDLTREINRILSNLAPILDRIPEGEAVEVNGYAFWADSDGPALCLLRRPHTLAPILAEIEREEQITDDQIDDAALLQAIADVDRVFPDSNDEIPDNGNDDRAFLKCSKCEREGWLNLADASRQMTKPCNCGGRWRMISGSKKKEAVRTEFGSIQVRNGSEEP